MEANEQETGWPDANDLKPFLHYLWVSSPVRVQVACAEGGSVVQTPCQIRV